MKQFKSGRVYGVFGTPCAGKSTLLKIIQESSRELIAIISTGDIARKLSDEHVINHMAQGNLFPNEEPLRAELFKLINNRKTSGADIIFLDGFPRFDDQIKWLVENQLIGSDGEGGLIQIVGEKLIERAGIRNRDEQDKVEALNKKIQLQQDKIYGMDKYISRIGIPYFTVMNTDLEVAAQHLSRIIGIRK